MNRREFLHPRQMMSIAAPMQRVADEMGSLVAREAPSSEPVMLRFARNAMATTFEIVFPFGTPSPNESAETALDDIDRIEGQLTVYRDTSEVSQLNSWASHHPVRVAGNLLELLALAQKIHGETYGAFDVSVGALIKLWGFYRRDGRVPSLEERSAVRERMGMEQVVLDAQRQTVFYRRHGLEINLGSIGKGHALDRAKQLISDSAPSFLMHGGHSSIVARGDEAPDKLGWTVGLMDPEQPQCRRGMLCLRNRAMATSAITYQHIENEGRKLGHLLDPRTGWPAEGMLSVTVTAPSAAEADALSTAFFILGIEPTRTYCANHPEIGAALIAANAPHHIVLLGRAEHEVQVLR